MKFHKHLLLSYSVLENVKKGTFDKKMEAAKLGEASWILHFSVAPISLKVPEM